MTLASLEAAWCVRLHQPATEFWRSTPRRVRAFFDALDATERATDHRFGVLASLIANAHLRKKGAPPFQASDFFASVKPRPRAPVEMTADEMRDHVMTHFGLTG